MDFDFECGLPVIRLEYSRIFPFQKRNVCVVSQKLAFTVTKGLNLSYSTIQNLSILDVKQKLCSLFQFIIDLRVNLKNPDILYSKISNGVFCNLSD